MWIAGALFVVFGFVCRGLFVFVLGASFVCVFLFCFQRTSMICNRGKDEKGEIEEGKKNPHNIITGNAEATHFAALWRPLRSHARDSRLCLSPRRHHLVAGAGGSLFQPWRCALLVRLFPPHSSALSGRSETHPLRTRGERSVPAAMEEVAERGRAGAGAAAMAEGGSAAGEEAANANAASSPPPCSPPEGGGTKPLSAAEYARRVHQWLWDSYCGYLGWQGCPPAFLAAAAAAAQPPPPAAAAYYSPFYLFAPPQAHTASAGTGPRAPAAATPAWPGAAGAVSPVPRAASGSATGTSASGTSRDTGRPAGEWGPGLGRSAWEGRGA